MQIVNGNHERRGYDLSDKGYYVAYHYFIGTDGTVIQTRPDSDRTMHTSNNDINIDSLGIVLAGDFEHDELPAVQLQALKKLVQSLAMKYKVSKSHIIAHKEASSTSCPGRHLEEALKAGLLR